MIDSNTLSLEKQKAIDEIFEDLPHDYSELSFQLSAIGTAFRTTIARSFEPQLNTFLRSKLLEIRTHGERRQLLAMIDSDLSQLGICASVDGRPALLVAERHGDLDSEDSHYTILTAAGPEGGISRINSDDFPSYRLMALPQNSASSLDAIRKQAYSFMQSVNAGRSSEDGSRGIR